MSTVFRRFIEAIAGAVIGYVGGIVFLYMTQGFYTDSIKIVVIAMLLGIFGSQRWSAGVLIAEMAIAATLFSILPSNASLTENPSVPALDTSYVTSWINGGWATLNGLVLYMNPEYACNATKNAVASGIVRTMKNLPIEVDNPNNIILTKVITNGADASENPKPNAVCVVALTVRGIPFFHFRVVTSSQGYSWSPSQ